MMTVDDLESIASNMTFYLKPSLRMGNLFILPITTLSAPFWSMQKQGVFQLVYKRKEFWAQPVPVKLI